MSMFTDSINDLISETTSKYEAGVEIKAVVDIPTNQKSFQLEGNKWLKIDDVICVFLDMKNSTQLSANKHDKSTAAIYEYFTGTAVKMLDKFGASYIDVRGDGAFGLFNKSQIYHAFACAVTFKSFVQEVINHNISIGELKINCHIGMDQKTVLVKKIGMRTIEDENDRQNEVWAGKPVNMASKLASIGGANDITVSERVFEKFKSDDSDYVIRSCGCVKGVPSDNKVDLWQTLDLNTLGLKESRNFDFDFAYVLKSAWCENHGQEYCEESLKLD